MAAESKAGVLTFKQLMTSLSVRPLCDGVGDLELSEDQEAALHAFLHEILASYHRLLMHVPKDKVHAVFDRRLAGANRFPA
jgi:hypothetical protein